ncbi:hypothetical protein D9M73_113440 [compost metagenome]
MHHADAIAQRFLQAAIRQHHLRHAKNAVERRADLMAGGGEELGFGGQGTPQRFVGFCEIDVGRAHFVAAAPDRNQAEGKHRDDDDCRHGQPAKDGLLGPRTIARIFDVAEQLSALQLFDFQLLVREIEAGGGERGVGRCGELGGFVVDLF